MPDENTTTAEGNTSEGDGQNTSTATTGAGTQAATSEAVDITQTPEFKAAVTAAIEKKIPQLKRQIGKELAGEKEGQPNVEELQRRAEVAETEARTLRAKDETIDFLQDPAKRIGARNPRAVYNHIKHDFEFDDDGKVANLKDLISHAKSDAPELFIGSGSANGGAGRQAPQSIDMNSELRRAAGRQT